MTKILKYLFSTRSLPIIICTSLMLFFLGIYFLVALKSSSLVKQIKNESNILVELSLETNDLKREEVLNLIHSQEGVDLNSISFIAKNKAREIMEEELGAGFLEFADENPFYDVFQFKIDNALGNASQILVALKENRVVHNAYAQASFVEEIASNVRKFSRIALVVGIFFSLLAVTLIFNAIKLSLVESKSSFYTLKLLGSDWNFIKKPFLQRAFYSGVLSSAIAIVLFLLSISYFVLSNELFSRVVNFWNIFFILFLMFLVGFFVNILSTNTILNRFLNMKEEDLYT